MGRQAHAFSLSFRIGANYSGYSLIKYVQNQIRPGKMQSLPKSEANILTSRHLLSDRYSYSIFPIRNKCMV